MPKRDPSEWFGRFFLAHMARFPGMTWPEPDSDEMLAMVQAWLFHFRDRQVTQAQADRASLALMLVPHYPNNHTAEFFKAIPEGPPDYLRVDPESAAYWIPGVVHKPRKPGRSHGGNA